jgi:hypothetical protein
MAEGARATIAAVASGFVEFTVDGDDHGPDGPLGWDGYGRSRDRAGQRTGTGEAVVCGRGKVGGREVVLICFEFGYFGGSVGTGTGARIEQALAGARESGSPVVSLIATGGTRMQKGMPALRQLQRIARQLVRLRDAGLPHVAVLRDPTTGGVSAASLGDARRTCPAHSACSTRRRTAGRRSAAPGPPTGRGQPLILRTTSTRTALSAAIGQAASTRASSAASARGAGGRSRSRRKPARRPPPPGSGRRPD